MLRVFRVRWSAVLLGASFTWAVVSCSSNTGAIDAGDGAEAHRRETGPDGVRGEINETSDRVKDATQGGERRLPDLGSGVRLTLLRTTVVDPQAMKIVDGPYGDYINGIAHEQQGLVTDGESSYQYVAWYTSVGTNWGRVRIAQRALGSSSWTTRELSDCELKQHGEDSHRAVAIGLARGDGTLHLAFGHHPLEGDPDEFNYKVSAQNASKTSWSSGYNPFPSSLKHTLGNNSLASLGRMTYPLFVSAFGDLVLVWRTRGSGIGGMAMSHYNTSTNPSRWESVVTIVSSAGNWGNYLFSDWDGAYHTCGTRSPYPNGVHFTRHLSDGKGRLHLSFLWREYSECPYATAIINGKGQALNNHDLSYLSLSVGGTSWYTYDEQLIASQNRPIQRDTPNVMLWDINPRWGLINTQAQSLDSKETMHVVLKQRDEAGNGYDRYTFASSSDGHYYHYQFDKNGRKPVANTNLSPGMRPKLLFDKNDTAYLIYNKDSHLTVAVATAATGWTDWGVAFTSSDQYCNEFTVDPDLLLLHGTISVKAQRCAAATAISSELRVVDIGTTGP